MAWDSKLEKNHGTLAQIFKRSSQLLEVMWRYTQEHILGVLRRLSERSLELTKRRLVVPPKGKFGAAKAGESQDP